MSNHFPSLLTLSHSGVQSFFDSDKTRIYFTSDTHFNHNKDFVFAARGYKDYVEHREALIAHINARVRPQDILIHAGDFCLNSSDNDFENLLSRIQCQNIVYLWGNHSNPLMRIYKNTIKEKYPGLTDVHEIYPLRYKNLIFVGKVFEFTVNGKHIFASHYPHYSWNHSSKEAWHVHGHIHSVPEKYDLKGKVLDIGIDYHKKVLSFDELKSIMDAKTVFNEGHH